MKFLSLSTILSLIFALCILVSQLDYSDARFQLAPDTRARDEDSRAIAETVKREKRVPAPWLKSALAGAAIGVGAGHFISKWRKHSNHDHYVVRRDARMSWDMSGIGS